DLCPFRFAIAKGCVILTNSVDSTINGIEVHCRMHAGKRRAILQVQFNHLIAQLVHKVSSPIPLEAWRIEGVEHALEDRLRHRANKIQGRSAKPTNGPERLLCFLKRSGITPDDPTHVLIVEGLRKRRSRWKNKKRKEAIKFLRRSNDEVTVKAHDLSSLVQMPQNRSSIDRADGMQPEEEGGDNTEIAAAPAHSPKQIQIFLSIGCNESAVCQNYIHLKQVIDGKTAFAC